MARKIYAEAIDSIASFLNFIETNCAEFENVLFRGQTKDWSLLPKLARLHCRDELTVVEAEKKMLASFKRRAIPLLDIVPDNDWDWLSIAQHSGMATRLLDWSSNPLAALWFAVEKPAINNESGVVWIFTPFEGDHITDPDSISPFKTERTRAFIPKHINKRIVAQHGWFTAHYVREKDSKFVALENNRRYKNKLVRLRIPPTAFAKLRLELDRCGINAATLFNDLSGLCRDSEWQYSLLDDEAENLINLSKSQKVSTMK